MNLRLMFITCVLGLLVVVPATAQPAVPGAGLVAEGDRRWDAAVAIYRDVLDRESHRADLWIRIADIEATRGRLPAVVDALERAAQITFSDPTVFARLSQAYSAAEQPRAAVEAIEGALALAPDNEQYLEARGELATWSGQYDRAQESYRRLRQLRPSDTAVALHLARVSAWSGDTNEACTMYREYLAEHPDDGAVWIELARAETWRGNYAAALDALEKYEALYGNTAEYRAELASILARAGRPTSAINLVEPLIQEDPESQSLHVTRTIARAMQQRHGDAFDELESMSERWPDTSETRSTRRVLQSALASTAVPEMRFYGDSDGLEVLTFDPTISVALPSGTSVGAGYQWDRLEARAGSGLDLPTGGVSAEHEQVWVSAAQRFKGVEFQAVGGHAKLSNDERWTYGLGVDVTPHDALTFSIERRTGFLTISPRTIGLGITRTEHHARLNWTPGIQYYIVADGLYQDLSDGNRRWELAISPRRSITRNEQVNVDLGASAYVLGVERDLNNGYYDPHLYENYAAVVYPYWKINEDVGLGGSVALGVQRDQRPGSFRFGGNAYAEATFGIYDPWMLNIHGSVTNNRRLNTGAFRGYSVGIGLTRRF